MRKTRTALQAKQKAMRAVMASRQAAGPEVLDFYPTPPWAARAGGELIRSLDPSSGLVAAEPACGEGHMTLGLTEYFDAVWSSDIFDYQGRWLPKPVLKDFLAPDWIDGYGPFDWIVTNPPFKTADDFARLAWKRTTRGVALLCRLAWLETVDRYQLLYRGEERLAVVAPFAERVPMHKGRWDPDGDTTTAYAWFVWLKPAALATCPLRHVIEGCWSAGGVLTQPIEPGARQRLHKRHDVELLCAPSDAPLLAGLT